GGYANAGVGTLTLSGAGNYTFNGTIRDGSSVTSATGVLTLFKTGTGNQTLTGANSYTGPTTISGGVLSVGTLAASGSNSGIGASGALTLDGGTLRYTSGASVGTANTSGFDRATTVGANGGTFDNASPNTGNWFITFNSVLSGSGTLNFISAQ